MLTFGRNVRSWWNPMKTQYVTIFSCDVMCFNRDVFLSRYVNLLNLYKETKSWNSFCIIKRVQNCNLPSIRGCKSMNLSWWNQWIGYILVKRKSIEYIAESFAFPLKIYTKNFEAIQRNLWMTVMKWARRICSTDLCKFTTKNEWSLLSPDRCEGALSTISGELETKWKHVFSCILIMHAAKFNGIFTWCKQTDTQRFPKK